MMLPGQPKNSPRVMTFAIECCSGGSSCESGTFSILNEVLRSIVVKMKGCRVEAAVMILLVLLLESGFFWKCIKIYVKSDFANALSFYKSKTILEPSKLFSPLDQAKCVLT